MELKDYIKKNAVNVAEFAKTLGISKQHLYEILRGEAYASRKLAVRIEKKSSGKVTKGEILFPKRPAA